MYFYALSEACRPENEELKDEAGGWTEVIGVGKIEHTADEDKEEIVPDETIHEVAVGKGLSSSGVAETWTRRRANSWVL